MCSNETYLFKNGSIRKKANMHNERRSHATCKVGDSIYVAGGINTKADAINSCEKFCLKTERWIRCSNMIVSKSHLSLCSVNNQYIYSIGGENKLQNLLDIIERYSISSDSWEVMNTRIPIKIECAACIYNSNEILILGGYSSDVGSMSTVFAYDITSNSIKKMNKELSQPGWSIYHPIKQGNLINLFYGGEEGFPPHHFVYELN